MWGLVLFDIQRGKLVISRDRIGIKPVYFINSAQYFAVASEIKQFYALPDISFELNYSAAKEFLSTGYENPGISFFKDVNVLKPGYFQVYQIRSGQLQEAQPYWHPERVGVEIHDQKTATDLFYQSFQQSVKEHLRSDVPVGCALSGGLDSSSIVAEVYKQNHGNNNLNTFYC